jgi:hypothetical protein
LNNNFNNYAQQQQQQQNQNLRLSTTASTPTTAITATTTTTTTSTHIMGSTNILQIQSDDINDSNQDGMNTIADKTIINGNNNTNNKKNNSNNGPNINQNNSEHLPYISPRRNAFPLRFVEDIIEQRNQIMTTATPSIFCNTNTFQAVIEPIMPHQSTFYSKLNLTSSPHFQ